MTKDEAIEAVLTEIRNAPPGAMIVLPAGITVEDITTSCAAPAEAGGDLTRDQLDQLAAVLGVDTSNGPPTFESLLALVRNVMLAAEDMHGFFRATIKLAYTMDWFVGTEIATRELGKHIFHDAMSRFIRLAELEQLPIHVPRSYDAAYVPPRHETL